MKKQTMLNVFLFVTIIGAVTVLTASVMVFAQCRTATTKAMENPQEMTSDNTQTQSMHEHHAGMTESESDVATEEDTDDAQTAEMEAHFKVMQAEMDKIMATTDPDERMKLMKAHMKSIQQGMMMMRCGVGQGAEGMMHMMQHKGSGKSCTFPCGMTHQCAGCPGCPMTQNKGCGMMQGRDTGKSCTPPCSIMAGKKCRQMMCGAGCGMMAQNKGCQKMRGIVRKPEHYKMMEKRMDMMQMMMEQMIGCQNMLMNMMK